MFPAITRCSVGQVWQVGQRQVALPLLGRPRPFSFVSLRHPLQFYSPARPLDGGVECGLCAWVQKRVRPQLPLLTCFISLRSALHCPRLLGPRWGPSFEMYPVCNALSCHKCCQRTTVPQPAQLAQNFLVMFWAARNLFWLMLADALPASCPTGLAWLGNRARVCLTHCSCQLPHVYSTCLPTGTPVLSRTPRSFDASKKYKKHPV